MRRAPRSPMAAVRRKRLVRRRDAAPKLSAPAKVFSSESLVLSLRCWSWLNVAHVWRLIAVLAAFAVGCSLLVAQPGSGDALLPIQRVLLKPDRVAKELEMV